MKSTQEEIKKLNITDDFFKEFVDGFSEMYLVEGDSEHNDMHKNNIILNYRHEKKFEDKINEIIERLNSLLRQQISKEEI